MAANITRLAGNTNEQVISNKRCRLYGIYPELTTTGTITVRNQATAAGGSGNIKHVTAIGLLQAGKTFGPGAVFENGLTVQLSVSTDLSAIVWEPM